MPDVPFLCDFPRAVTLVDGHGHTEIAHCLKVHRERVDRVLATLSYFDLDVLGTGARSPALFSVGLMDKSCPPPTVYAAFNACGGSKEIVEYPFSGHDGGGRFHEIAKVRWLAQRAVAEPQPDVTRSADLAPEATPCTGPRCEWRTGMVMEGVLLVAHTC